MGKHSQQVENGIGEIAVGLFRIRRDEGFDAYVSELKTIISYFTTEYLVAKTFNDAKKSPPLEAALEAVSKMRASLVKDNGFEEGVKAAFPNSEGKATQEDYEVFRGKHP